MPLSISQGLHSNPTIKKYILNRECICCRRYLPTLADYSLNYGSNTLNQKVKIFGGSHMNYIFYSHVEKNVKTSWMFFIFIFIFIFEILKINVNFEVKLCRHLKSLGGHDVHMNIPIINMYLLCNISGCWF